MTKEALYTEYVNILNGVLQLSKREAEVFSFLIMFDANGHQDNINSSLCRSVIKNTLSVSESNLSRYLNTIKSKALIVKSITGKWVLNDNLRPSHESIIEVTFTLDANDTSGNTNQGFSQEISEGSESD